MTVPHQDGESCKINEQSNVHCILGHERCHPSAHGETREDRECILLF